MKRRTLVVAVSVAATFALAAWLETAVNGLLCGLLLAAAIPLALFPVTRRRAITLLLFCCAAAFAIHAAWTVIKWEQVQRWDGCSVSVKATVQQMTYTDYGTNAVLCVSEGLPSGTLVEVRNVALTRYDTVYAQLRVHTYDSSGLTFHRNRAKGVYLYGQPIGEWSVLRGEDKPWYAVFTELGDDLQRRLVQWLPDERGALLGAVCLGNKEFVSRQTKEDFRAAGLSHLLALSGLHLSVLQGVIYRVLRRLRAGKRLCALLTVVLVWMFVLTVGASASLTRAAVMISLTLAARILFLRADALNSLGVALLLVLLADPFAVYDEGLLLSFGATLGILLFSPRWNRAVQQRLKDKGQTRAARGAVALVRAVCDGLGLSLSALVFTVPITVIFFGSAAWITPLSNVLAVPVMSAAVSIGFAALFVMALPVIRYLAPLLLLPAAWLADLGIRIAHLAASAQWMSWMSAALVAALAVGAMWKFWLSKDKKEAQYDTGAVESTDQERTV